MGYILSLKIKVPDNKQNISYQSAVFYTAKIVKTNIQSGDTLTNENDNFFEIDDKKNNSLLDEDLFNTFFDWRNGKKIFEKNALDLNKIQYLEFKYDSFPIYVCLCQGIEDPYCFIRIFPDQKVNYVVEKTSNGVNPIYDLEMTLWFLI